MIVNRHSWVVREGHTFEEAMELLKGAPSAMPRAARVLRESVMVQQGSPAVVCEYEFGSLAAMEEQWLKLFSDSGFGSFLEQWRVVLEINSHRSDVWFVMQ